MIRISASALKDFNTCKKKLYFRQQRLPRQATASLILGSAVHDLIDEYELGGDPLEEYRNKLVRDLSSENVKFYRGQTMKNLLGTLETCYANYLELAKLLPEVNEPEVSFDIPFVDGAKVIGRFDQLCANNTIVELKSSKKKPTWEWLNSDIQASVYIWAYEKLHGVVPTYYYIHLLSGTVYELTRNNKEELVDNMHRFADACKADYLPREMASYKCNFCDYKGICIPSDTSKIVYTAKAKVKPMVTSKRPFASF